MLPRAVLGGQQEVWFAVVKAGRGDYFVNESGLGQKDGSVISFLEVNTKKFAEASLLCQFKSECLQINNQLADVFHVLPSDAGVVHVEDYYGNSLLEE